MYSKKIHMGNSSASPRTRCGLMKASVCWTPYGSLGTTCNTCRRLHAQDMAKGGDDQ